MARIPHDFYETPPWLTQELLKLVDIKGVVVEPCVGDGAIINALDKVTGITYFTNDIDIMKPADMHMDASDSRLYTDRLRVPVDWVVTNPPYQMPMCFNIVRQARHYALNVAVLLRLSFLEPTRLRELALVSDPPDKLIITPRVSFTQDGRKDTTTTAWMVWGPDALTKDARPIVVLPLYRGND